jgi:putative transposase
LHQQRLIFSKDGRGGAREGAGRKPLPVGQRRTPHRSRGEHQSAHPVHVMLRARVRSLRSRHMVRTLLGALRDSNGPRFRIAHYSIQANHLHLIVEAEGKAQLATGMRSVAVRLARRVNKLLFRRGQFWADRWHGHTLKGPRQLRNALVFVLQNFKKHARVGVPGPALDILSSAQWFDGFADKPAAFRSIGPPCVVEAKTWLLRLGWRRHGRIRTAERPQPG